MADNPNIKVTADVSDATSALQRLSQSMQSLQKKVGSSLGELSTNMKNTGNTLKTVGNNMADVGAKGFVSITLPIAGLTKQILDVGSNMVSFEATYKQVFKGLASSASSWSASFGKSIGLNSTVIKQSLLDFQSYSQNMGMTGKSALNFSEKMTSLTADLSAFKNMDMSEAGDRLMAMFRGEYDSAEALGLAINETTIKQEMMREGLQGQFSDLDQTTKMQLLYNLAMYQSKDAQGQAAREADQYQNKIQNLKAQLAYTAQQLFTIMLPVIQQVMSVISGLITWFNSLSDSTKKWILIIAGVAAVIMPIILYLGILISVIGTVITIVGAIIGALSVFIGTIGFVGVAIIALAILAVKNWDAIKSFFISAWQAIKDYFASTWATMKGQWADVKADFASGVARIKQIFIGLWEGIKSGASTVYSAITAPFARAWDFISGIAAKIKSVFNFSISAPSVNTSGIRYNAKGGIFNSATLLGGGNVVGESSSSEAVIPLNSSVLGAIGAGMFKAMTPDNMDSGNVINNNFELNGWVVREEADVKKIGQELYRLQQRENRARGRSRF